MTQLSLREQGNQYFRNKQYFDAEKCYIAAIAEADQNDKRTLAILHTNLAYTQNQIEKVPLALENATKAIEYDNTYVKAYLRKSESNVNQLNFTDAYNDLVHACHLDPSSKEIRERIAQIKQKIDSQTIRRGFSTEETARPNRPKTPSYEPKETPVFDRDYAITLMSDMMKFKRPLTHVVNAMLDEMKAINKQLPNIVHINIKKQIRVVGDVHGQYQDFLQLFEKYGYPSSENQYLFNGDYVDRGSMGIEILLALFAWKLADPDSIFMNRGNQYVIFSPLIIFHFSFNILKLFLNTLKFKMVFKLLFQFKNEK